MIETFEEFKKNRNNNLIFLNIKNYRPEIIFIIQDSEVARKNIVHLYSPRFKILSGVIEKKDYSLICKIDNSVDEFSAKQIVKNFNKPIIITCVGLYGEMYIKEIRMFEKINNIKDRIPIIIYGSPKEDKLNRLHNLIDLFIDNTHKDSFKKIDWFINQIIISE